MVHTKQKTTFLNENFIRTQVDFYIRLWERLSTQPYPLQGKKSRVTLKINQLRTTRRLKALSRILTSQSGVTHPEQQRVRCLSLLKELCSLLTGLEEDSQELVFAPPSLAATCRFIQQAREYNPLFSPAEIYQALRNVWVMNTIQLFLGRKVACTPAVFAYSALYPYTDNYLDDPVIPLAEKEGFCARFHQRLAGSMINPANARELSIFRLIDYIESEFPRGKYPNIFSGLQAINRAQAKSLAQHRSRISETEILRLSFEKGGTSVLNDALLVKGDLSGVEAAFFFGLGVLTQLADDLQDVGCDRENHHRTLFSSPGAAVVLDPYLGKLFRLLDYLLSQSRQYHFPRNTALEDLYSRGCRYLFLEAVAKNPDCYSADCLKRVAPYLAFTPAYYRELDTYFDTCFRDITPDKICDVFAKEKATFFEGGYS